MAYIIEKKQGKQIYLYQVESYWDKEKKQARQKRKYIGKKVEEQEQTQQANIKYEAKDYGQIYLIKQIAKEIGLDKILKEVFRDKCEEILEITYYEITEANPLYLYESWREATSLSDEKKERKQIENVIEELGNKKEQRYEFFQKWIGRNNKGQALVFDITSLSSYGKENALIEWGYNRDGEELPQCNLGVVYNEESLVPLYYKVYPGSIADVSTLKNTVSDLVMFGAKESLFILDRGFYSATNIEKMNQEKIEFLIPMPKTVASFDKLMKQSYGLQTSIDKLFSYKSEVLAYEKQKLQIGKVELEAHIYFNRKRKNEEELRFLRKLLDIEETIINKGFTKEQEVLDYLALDSQLSKYFTVNFSDTKLKLTRNNKEIEEHLGNKGIIILLASKPNLARESVLSLYRQKDYLEKIFDILKNEFDGKRLRCHSQASMEARLFIKFLALILYSALTKKMKISNMFKLYSIKEIFYELKKLRIISINSSQFYLSEISKKQKEIFSKLDIQIPSLLT